MHQTMPIQDEVPPCTLSSSEKIALRDEFHAEMLKVQNLVAGQLEFLDPQLQVKRDPWRRAESAKGEDQGGGLSLFAADGEYFEKAGVHVSCVYGDLHPNSPHKVNHQSTPKDFFATGISLIIHPRSPKVPTVHANFRLISMGDKLWFGGGADLTPYYPYPDDFAQFHRYWFKTLGEKRYSRFKAYCDDYFCNHHRGHERRGVGGFFFDYYLEETPMVTRDLAFHWANAFNHSYFPLVRTRMTESYTPEEEAFMLYRRGRYVEFNLIHDRGTHFGLQTNGRIESILSSLSPRCTFHPFYPDKENVLASTMNPYYFPREYIVNH